MKVLSESWLPPRLRFREEKIDVLSSTLSEQGVATVVGPSGVGKSTLVRLALHGAVIVDCCTKRTAASIGRELAKKLNLPWRGLVVLKEELAELEPATVVLDDYTMAQKTKELLDLLSVIRARHRVVLVVHPSARYAPGVEGPAVEMPPYAAEELYGILEDRVVAGQLPVSEEALWEISNRLGLPKGPGSARLAITALRLALVIAMQRHDPEVTSKHANAALLEIASRVTVEPP